MHQLRPAAENLSPALIAIGKLAPKPARLLRRPAAGDRARRPTGFPALRKFLREDFPPLLRPARAVLRNLNPLLQALGLYKREIDRLPRQRRGGDQRRSELARRPTPGRSSTCGPAVPLGPDSLAAYPRRLLVNRANPYMKPLGTLNLRAHGDLESFETRQCTSGINAILREWTELSATEQANFQTSDRPARPRRIAEDLYNRLRGFFAFDNERNSNDLPAPPCAAQGPTSRWASRASRRPSTSTFSRGRNG